MPEPEDELDDWLAHGGRTCLKPSPTRRSPPSSSKVRTDLSGSAEAIDCPRSPFRLAQILKVFVNDRWLDALPPRTLVTASPTTITNPHPITAGSSLVTALLVLVRLGAAELGSFFVRHHHRLDAVMTTRFAKSGDEVEAVSTKTRRINRTQQKVDEEH